MKPEYRLRCDESLRLHIVGNLRDFSFKVHRSSQLRKAAVAITVVSIDAASRQEEISSCSVEDEDAALILTRRSVLLKHHAGQWAIPGGYLEEGETPEETAMRELREEVNLTLTEDHILGRLDDFTTRSGFVMTPIVFWGGSQVELRPNPQEVHSVHRIPIREFLRPDSPILESNSDSRHPILHMPVGNSSIAAPTAALLFQFREVAIMGKQTRVAHYEQPQFAWR